MNKILYFLCVSCLGISSYAQTQYSSADLEKMFDTHLSDYTNSVAVTTNVIFFLTADSYGYPTNQFMSDEQINTGLAQTPVSLHATNLISFYRIPYNQTFNFHLYDKAGVEVKKTDAGLAMSQPVNPTQYGRGIENIALGRNVGKLIYQVIKMNEPLNKLFKPDDWFSITNKGVYDLSISMRICVPMTNGVTDTHAMRDWHVISQTFGVVESPALHVKVIKE